MAGFGLFGSGLVSNQKAIPNGILGADPNGWQVASLIGSGLQDAYDAYRGKSGTHLDDAMQGMRQDAIRRGTQGVLADMQSSDPAIRQAAYAKAPLLGIDPKAFQAQQASAAAPQLLQNLQPQLNQVQSTPAIDLNGGSGQVQQRQAAGAYSAPIESTPSLTDALTATNSPELSAQYAPEIIKQQLERQQKAVRTLMPNELPRYGVDPTSLAPGTVPQVDANGVVSFIKGGDTKSKAAMQQTLQEKIDEANGVPMTAAQTASNKIAQSNLAVSQAHLGIDRDNLNLKKGGALDDDTVGFMADQILSGDKSPFQNLGRGQQGAQNIVRLRQAVTQKAIARGLKGSDVAALNAEFAGLQAGERTLGTRTANVEMAASEVQQLAPLALEASARVNRSQFPSLNKIELAVKQGTGDENVIRLNQAVNGLVNTYSRAISPSGTPTVSDKEHAREILEAAYSKGQFNAAVDQMQKEIAAARKSPGSVRGEFRAAISGGQPGMASVPDAPSRAAQIPSPQSLPRVQAPAADPQSIVNELRKRGVIK